MRSMSRSSRVWRTACAVQWRPRMTDTRERDILVASNEYAYVQDLTKGDIVLYVGPTKISLSEHRTARRLPARSLRSNPRGRGRSRSYLLHGDIVAIHRARQPAEGSHGPADQRKQQRRRAPHRTQGRRAGPCFVSALAWAARQNRRWPHATRRRIFGRPGVRRGATTPHRQRARGSRHGHELLHSRDWPRGPSCLGWGLRSEGAPTAQRRRPPSSCGEVLHRGCGQSRSARAIRGWPRHLRCGGGGVLLSDAERRDRRGGIVAIPLGAREGVYTRDIATHGLHHDGGRTHQLSARPRPASTSSRDRSTKIGASSTASRPTTTRPERCRSTFHLAMRCL